MQGFFASVRAASFRYSSRRRQRIGFKQAYSTTPSTRAVNLTIELAPTSILRMAKPKSEPIPKVGNHMFIEYCEEGDFIDDDGYGNYATVTEMMSNKHVVPSDVEDDKIYRRYTHVVWFNS